MGENGESGEGDSDVIRERAVDGLRWLLHLMHQQLPATFAERGKLRLQCIEDSSGGQRAD